MNLSVITINFNNLEGLKKTVDSVLRQTYVDFEYIVIDGGSSDGSKEFLVEIADSVDFWVSEKDEGIYDAMNKGIGKAKGEYLMFLNSGDRLCSKNTLLEVFSKSHDADVVYGNVMIDRGTEIIRRTNGPKGRTNAVTYFLYDTIYHQSSFIKRATLSSFGNYNEEYRIVSDWVMFLRMALNKAEFEYIDVDVSFFDGNGISSQNVQQNEKERSSELSKAEYAAIYPDYLAIKKLKNSLAESKEYRIVKSSKILKLLIRAYLRWYYWSNKKRK